ncbi:S-adenosyl-L-methionine-dependent methyltransferase [Bombardia bombarda]|uniref:S-adenosyl-L-methionine-dependent methyltransferase n=1 Tax=Bombardia bombarda TaxID=252184 RepID=A0AA39WGU7_9PEZI|nr:S-adenosyl-L-methionine-dependent methyltransferase [Bombardia bombarda]
MSTEADPVAQADTTAAAETGILPAEHWAAQAADDSNDRDSSLGDDDNSSSTASLSSTILDYRTINGRTFHSERGDANYWATNDDKQNESLDINHHACTLALDGKLFLAPLKKDIQNVLDIGTGTGIWAIDFADEFPQTIVVGTDLSPIQPSWVPPNLKFEIEDCSQTWTFSEDYFDYVHMRWLVGSLADWEALAQNAFTCLKPGGWFEWYEMSAVIESDDDTVTDKTALSQWGKIFIDGGKKIGRSFTLVQDDTQRKVMEKAGFVDIQYQDVKMPIGSWPADRKNKEMGQFSQVVLEQDPEGYILFMTTTLGWTRPEIMVYIAALRKEVRSGKYHPYYKQRIVWGRKPE